MAEGGNIIEWNFTNWMTVILMAAIGFTVVGFVVKTVKSRKQGQQNASA